MLFRSGKVEKLFTYTITGELVHGSNFKIMSQPSTAFIVTLLFEGDLFVYFTEGFHLTLLT